MSTSTRIPKMCRHRLKGRPDAAYVRLPGVGRIGLGQWNTPEARREYKRVIREWLDGGGPAPERELVTVGDLTARFMAHARRHYVRPDGSTTNEVANYGTLQGMLDDLFGDMLAAEFSPSDLKLLRDEMVDRGWARSNVNGQVRRVVRMWKYGVEHELVDAPIFERLKAVSPLQRGRTDARETDPIKPVPRAHIDAVREHVSSPVRAMIDLQLLLAARPGEVIGLRAVDLDTSGEVWVATLEHHKTSYRGRERHLYLGPRAQEIVQPFMAGRALDAPLFSPKEAHTEIRQRGAKGARRPNQKANPKKTDRTLGDAYTVDSYRRAIHRACRAVGVQQWSPNRLRHTRATELRKLFGLESTQAVLGHSELTVTQVYAEVDHARAIEIARQVG